MIEAKESNLRVPRLTPDDTQNLRTHNSIMSYISKKSEGDIVPEEDKESYESSSPDKCSDLTGYFGFKDSGRLRQKLSDEFKEKLTKPDNTWIRNIDELCSVNLNLNSSIVEGP
jgi:hypothetical protein